MADILEKIAKTEGEENEISLGELEKHFDEITNDEENDDKQVSKLIKVLENNIDKNSEKLFDAKNIIKDIFTKENFSTIKYNPNTIKVYKLCKRLEDKQERKMDGELPQEMIKDWVIEKQKNAGIFSSESVYYDDQQQNLVIKTPFGEYIQPFQESKKGTIKMDMDKAIPNVSYTPGKLSDFFTIIDSEESIKDFIKEERIALFDKFVEANPNPDKEDSDTEKISMSEDGVMTIDIKNDAYDASMETLTIDTQNIPGMPDLSGRDGKTDVEKILYLIQQQRDGLKAIKESRVSENAALNTIIAKNTFTAEDMQVVNEWTIKNRDIQPNKLKEVQTKVDTMIDAISIEVNKKIGANVEGNVNYYTKDQVKMFQLRANVCFGENISLDGKRGNLFYSSLNDDNQKLTNIYIYRQELITRKEVIDARKNFNLKEFNDLLNIPNLNELLSVLGDEKKQNQVFSQFLEFFRDIKEAGMMFENLIGNKSLQLILNYMISAKENEGILTSTYIQNLENTKEKYVPKEKNKEKLELLDFLIDDIKKSGAITMDGYYQQQVDETKKKILQANESNITYNKALWKTEKQNEIEEKIKLLEEELAKYDKSEIDKEGVAVTNINGDELNVEGLNIDLSNVDISNIQVQPNCSTQVVTDKHMLYNLGMMKKSNDEMVQYVDELGLETLKKDIPNNRLFTERGKKQIQILELKLQLYEVTENPFHLDEVYLSLQKSFSDDDIKKFFDLKKDNQYCTLSKTISEYGVSYQGFQQRIEKLENYLDDVDNEYSINREIYDANNVLSMANNKVVKVEDGGEQTTLLRHPDGYVYESGKHSTIKVTINEGGENVVENIPMPKGFDIASFNKQIDALPKNQHLTKYPSSSDMPRAIVKYEDDGTVNLYAPKSFSDLRPGKLIKTISSSTMKKTTEYNKIAVDMAQDRETQQSLGILSEFSNDFQGIRTIYEKYTGTEEKEKQRIDDTEANKVLNRAVDFETTKLEKYEYSVPMLKRLMEKIDSGSANSELYSRLQQQKDFLSQMIAFFESGNARTCIESLQNIESNDSPGERVRIRLRDNLVKTLFAIAGGVIAMILAAPSGGTSIWAYIASMSLYTAAATALGGMVGSRIGQWTNEGIQNIFFAKEVNGHIISYDDPTDIELYWNGDIGHGEFRGGIGLEFLRATATTFAFLKAGQIIGNGLVNSGIIKNLQVFKGSAYMNKFLDASKKIILPKTKIVADNSIKSFSKMFSSEFGEETFEEIMESGAEKIHPALGGLVTILNCLSGPNAGSIFTKNNVAGGKMSLVGESMIQEMTYDSNDIQDLEEYFTKGLEYTKLDPTGDGKIRFEKNMAAEDIIQSKSGKTINKHIIEFMPSKASTFINNSAEFFEKYGMKVNHEATNEVFIENADALLFFKAAIEMGGMGNVAINTDGSAKFITGEETIHIKLSDVGVHTETTNTVSETNNNIKTETETNNISPENNLTIDEVVDTYTKLVEKLPPVEPGKIRCYRGIKPVGLENENALPLTEAEAEKLYEYKSTRGQRDLTTEEDAEFRDLYERGSATRVKSFSPDLETAIHYGFDGESFGKLLYVDITIADMTNYRVANGGGLPGHGKIVYGETIQIPYDISSNAVEINENSTSLDNQVGEITTPELVIPEANVVETTVEGGGGNSTTMETAPESVISGKTKQETILENINNGKYTNTQPFVDLESKYNELRSVIKEEKKADFDSRFFDTLELHNQGLIFKNKNGEIVTKQSINDYLINLGVEPTSDLGKKINEYAFYQTLDNPPQYNSHGFDHSINVGNYVEMIYTQLPVFVTSLETMYGLDSETSKFVLEMTAVLHDFGYPETENIKAPKSLHGPLGAIVFEKNIMPEFKKHIQSKNPNITEAQLDQLCTDMYNAVFFHSADKVEVTYHGKMTYNNMTFLFENEAGVENILTALEQSGMFTDQINRGEISFEINSQNTDLVDKIKTKYGDKTNITTQDKTFKGRTIGKDLPGAGIEFQTSSMNSPLSSIIRIADNLDIAYTRLSPLQQDQGFRDLIHSFGPECSGGKLMELMEKYDDMVKDMKDGKKTQSDVDKSFDNIQTFILNNPKIEIFVNGTKTEIDLSSDNVLDGGKPNTKGYKNFLMDKIGIIDATVRDVGLKQDSRSVRHSGGLEPIKNLSDVVIGVNENGEYIITVNVDKAKFDELNGTTVVEKGKDADGNDIFVEVGIGEYHVRRLYEATRSIDLGGQNCKLQVKDSETGELIDMGYTYQGTKTNEGKVSFDKGETYQEVINSGKFGINYDVKEINNNGDTEYFLSVDQVNTTTISTLGKNIITIDNKKYFKLTKDDVVLLTEASKI